MNIKEKINEKSNVNYQPYLWWGEGLDYKVKLENKVKDYFGTRGNQKLQKKALDANTFC